MKMKRHIAIVVLLLAAGCTRAPQQREETTGERLRLSLETKALGAGERTFSVALFTGERNYTGRSGSYCTTTYTNSALGFTWLQPCRVNDAGEPLDDGGAIVPDLALADHNSLYGLRWNGGTETRPVELVALSPALKVHSAGVNDQYAYVDWTVGGHKTMDAIYISEPVPGSFSGSWVDREYVYDSDASLSGSMKDPRAAVKVHIECGRLDEGDVRSVVLSNRLTQARFYLESKDDIGRGFYLEDPSLITFDAQTLYTCPPGAPMHITQDPSTQWTSAEILLPAMAYSALPDTRRPVLTVVLGDASLSEPFTARVVLNQDLEPMKEYTYTLRISKAYVHTYFSPSLSWDSAGNIQSIDGGAPIYLGAAQIDDPASGWGNGGGGSSEGWN